MKTGISRSGEKDLIKKYLELMRVHHYIKNLLIFAVLVFHGQFFVWEKLSRVIVGFIMFCLVSSAVYIINDIRDKEKDQLHPTKRLRPVASGEIPVGMAWGLAIFLLTAAAVCSMAMFRVSANLLLVLYFVINLGYSYGLKNIPLLDISILAGGFLIRVMYGAAITDIPVSNWLYLTVISMAFYFALGKRRNELRGGADGTRKVLAAYPMNFLDKNMYMCLALANVFYALWSMDAGTAASYHKNMVYSVPIVMLITMKYSLDVESETCDGDPVEVLLHDRFLLLLCAGYLVIMGLILYL